MQNQQNNYLKKLVILLIFVAFVFFLIQVIFPKRHNGFTQKIESSGLPINEGYGGISWGDIDNDGYLDLLIRKHPLGYRLYRNNGDESFTDVTESYGLDITAQASSATFGDFNNDGCVDIYVTSGLFGYTTDADSDILYKNNCQGHFEDVSTDSSIFDNFHTTGVAWGDYNNDGFADIYVSTYGFLFFTKLELEWKLEDWKYEPNILYRNNGDGTFTNVSHGAGVLGIANCPIQGEVSSSGRTTTNLKANWQPAWFDYNNDEKTDLYVSNEATVNVLYKNNGDGTFEDVTEKAGLCLNHSTHGVAIGDYNNDGYMDIYTTGTQNNLLWKNNGDGTFSQVAESAGVSNTGFLGWGTGFLDFNNDGFLDIYSINGSSDNTSIKADYSIKTDKLYQNKGDGTFEDVTKVMGISGNDLKTFGAFADYNNDGFTDIFIISDSGAIKGTDDISRLYRNMPNGNNWITIKLQGTSSNRDALGAKIILETDKGKQYREVVSGGSLLSQNSLWQTFGLGKTKIINSVEIQWPSGIVQKLENIEVNQIIKIVEASS